MTALDVNIRTKIYPPTANTTAYQTIDSLAFSAADTEFVCLFGPSGCGKTTLLNIIAGLDTDFDGEISFAPGVSTKLAYVFQSPRLLPWRTVTENIAVVLSDESQIDGITRGLIRDVGLEKFADAYPNQLSMGMQRRAALARAFAVQPRLLLMDEPFVSLDEPAAEKLRNLLIDLWQSRPTTVLFVTHDYREAIRLADRLLVLSEAPSRIIRNIDITLSREERMETSNIETFRKESMADL